MSNEQRIAFFRKRIPIYKKDICVFAKEILKFSPDDWQKAVFRDVVEHNRISVKSGQGVGKTGLEAVVLLWFLTCFPFPRIVATAPTRQQLNDVLWSEVAKWQTKSPLLTELLKWTKTYIYMVGYEKRWFAVAKTATKPENMQGFHEDNMLFIVDEASGVADLIMEAILGTLSGGNNKLLMCGNPTKASGVFYDSHTADRDIYRCHTVSSLDSPRTNKENIAALIRKYGQDSNVVRVRVIGTFPLQEDDVFIPISLIEQGIMTDLETNDTDEDGRGINRILLGVDVARFGDDETVIALNVGGRITIPIKRRGQNLMATVGDIVIQYRKTLERYPKYKKNIYAVIDDTGLGGGVTDRLREVKTEQNLSRLIVCPVNAASAVPDQKAALQYANITTWMWARVRDMLTDKMLQIENDTLLVAQFSTRKYGLRSDGRIILETKKEMKKRGLDSPDIADAVCLATYEVKMFDLSNLL